MSYSTNELNAEKTNIQYIEEFIASKALADGSLPGNANSKTIMLVRNDIKNKMGRKYDVEHAIFKNKIAKRDVQGKEKLAAMAKLADQLGIRIGNLRSAM